MTARERVSLLEKWAETEAEKRPSGYFFPEPPEYSSAVQAVRHEAELRGWNVRWVPFKGSKGISILRFAKGERKMHLDVTNDFSPGLLLEDVHNLRNILDEIEQTP